jgi:predicted aspartyl protease
MHYSLEVIVERIERNSEVVPIRALLDTGTAGTLLLKQYVPPNTPKAYIGQHVVCSTLRGTFQTKKKVIATFKFPDFSKDKEVTWKVHVENVTDSTKSQ